MIPLEVNTKCTARPLTRAPQQPTHAHTSAYAPPFPSSSPRTVTVSQLRVSRRAREKMDPSLKSTRTGTDAAAADAAAAMSSSSGGSGGGVAVWLMLNNNKLSLSESVR